MVEESPHPKQKHSQQNFGQLGVDYRRMNQVVNEMNFKERSHLFKKAADSFSNEDDLHSSAKIEGVLNSISNKPESTLKKKKSQSDSQVNVAEEDQKKLFMENIINKYSRKREKADSAPLKDEAKDSSNDAGEDPREKGRRALFKRVGSSESNKMSLYSGLSMSKKS